MKVKEESEKAGLKSNIQKTKIMASGPTTSWQIDGETMETLRGFTFWAPKSLQMVTTAMQLKDTCFLEEKLWPPRQHFKKQRHYFANKGPSSQSCGFSRSHVWIWELDYKESCVPNNWCIWTVVLEKILERPLDCKGVQPVHSEGDQPRIFTGSLMLKLKFQYFGHLMQRTDSLEKTLMVGKIKSRRRRGWQRIRWLDGITDLMDSMDRLRVWASSGSWWWTGKPGML